MGSIVGIGPAQEEPAESSVQINNFTREFIKKIYFYFLFTKLHFTTFL